MPYHEQISPVPLRVAVIGGGTGNSTVLEGMKPWVSEGLTAIVNTFDDGGGTGKLRTEYGGIAVGDLRQCARAMSDLSPDALSVLEGRFSEGTKQSDMNVHGQTVGNLMLQQAHQMFAGDPDRIAAAYGDIYRISGKVLPVSHDNRRLRTVLTNGRVIEGEHNLEEDPEPSLRGAKVGFNIEPTEITPEVEAAIKEADMVVLAPGDLYTSLAPTLVLRGMKEALRGATAVVQVSNLMNRNQHTVDFTSLDYAQEYERLIGDRVIDRVLFNTQSPDPEALTIQAKLGSHPVNSSVKSLELAGYTAIGKDLLSYEPVILSPDDAIAESRSQIRHDPKKVAHALMAIYFGNGFAGHELRR